MRLFFELIQVALGRLEVLSSIPTEKQWFFLYEQSIKQALTGVCLAGIDRLPVEYHPPIQLLLEWIGYVEIIKNRNSLVTSRSREVYSTFEKDGLRSCVLKGQGLAALYEFPNNKTESLLYRQCGDIDIWVDGARDEIIKYMRSHYDCGRAVIHHIDVNVFDDVPVEVHFVPSYTYSLLRYKVYKEFFKECKDECFASSELGFSVPSFRFNAIYVLMHIYRHVFHEGVGLRQLMDYYFVLQKLNLGDYEFVNEWLKRLGLKRFAAAVLYVEKKVFSLNDDLLYCEPDPKAGGQLLNRIMKAGNFGQYDVHNQEAHKNGALVLYFNNVSKLFSMLKYYPTEVLSAPFWKIGHFCWRFIKGY